MRCGVALGEEGVLIAGEEDLGEAPFPSCNPYSRHLQCIMVVQNSVVELAVLACNATSMRSEWSDVILFHVV